MKSRSLLSYKETLRMLSTREEEARAEITKFRIQEAFLIVPDKLKQLVTVQNITSNSHQNKETIFLG